MNNELINQQNNQPMTSEDYLINILKTQKEEKQKVQELMLSNTDHERRLKELESNVPINGALNNYLSRIRRSKVLSALGGKLSKAYKHTYNDGEPYKTLSGKCFAYAMREFNKKFNLSNYAELKQHQYEDAVKFWSEFELSKELQQEIYNINNQLVLDFAV